jgi:DtxR family Mn-dependent transcriptional regulator
MPSKTIEEYIETIFLLQQKQGRARTNDIASVLALRPSSVTEMLQKLTAKGLVEYRPYYGATLNYEGEKLAKELMVRHKTLANFLQIIGVDNETAETDACQIEHHVTSETMERLNKFVDFVQTAPREPRWLKHFKFFYKTNKRPECEAGSFGRDQ